MNRKFRKTAWMVAFFALITGAMLSAGLAFAQEPSGTVEISEYELAYIFNGNLGGGKLYFNGNEYDFKIGGLGIGGIGASHISATGSVYNLKNVWDFPGTYVQGSVGFSATDQGQGHLWLKNQNGVELKLRTHQEGLGLTAGADGIVVQMNQ